MQQSSDIVWRPSRAKRHLVRWFVGLGAVVVVLGYLNGGMPTEPALKLPPKQSQSAAVSAGQTVGKAAVTPRVEPVRILNPLLQPAPRVQAVARPSPVARSSADYQALRRELLSRD
jgi:hypothetical protein